MKKYINVIDKENCMNKYVNVIDRNRKEYFMDEDLALELLNKSEHNNNFHSREASPLDVYRLSMGVVAHKIMDIYFEKTKNNIDKDVFAMFQHDFNEVLGAQSYSDELKDKRAFDYEHFDAISVVRSLNFVICFYDWTTPMGSSPMESFKSVLRNHTQKTDKGYIKGCDYLADLLRVCMEIHKNKHELEVV